MSVSLKQLAQMRKIVDAAGQLFALQGYHGTSTREIARSAEISENTLFRYFDHKEDIFWAALRSRLSGLELGGHLVESISQGKSPDVVLPQIVAQLVEGARMKPEMLRLIAIAVIELQGKAAAVCQEHLSPILCAVRSYLEGMIAGGRLRDLDSGLVTAALIASVIAHPELSKMTAVGSPDHSEEVRLYSDFWLGVLKPAPAGNTTA